MAIKVVAPLQGRAAPAGAGAPVIARAAALPAHGRRGSRGGNLGGNLGGPAPGAAPAAQAGIHRACAALRRLDKSESIGIALHA